MVFENVGTDNQRIVGLNPGAQKGSDLWHSPSGYGDVLSSSKAPNSEAHSVVENEWNHTFTSSKSVVLTGNKEQGQCTLIRDAFKYHFPLCTLVMSSRVSTILRTPWSRALLDKLTGSQLVMKFPAFYEIRRFIAALERCRHLSLSRARSIQSMPHTPFLEHQL
jgi:hypothetical protein